MKLLLLLLGLFLLAQTLPLKPARSLLVKKNADPPGGGYRDANDPEEYLDPPSGDYNETLGPQPQDPLHAEMAVQAAKDFDEYQKDPVGYLSRLRPMSELEAILRAEASQNGSSNETTTDQPVGIAGFNETTTELPSGFGGSNETYAEETVGIGGLDETATESPSGMGGFNETATEKTSGALI